MGKSIKLKVYNVASTNKETNNALLLIAIATVILFVIGHVYGITVLLYAGILMMMVGFAFFSDDILYLELLYIPLAGILKLSPDGTSLLSYTLLIGMAVFLGKRKIKIDKKILICTGMLFTLMLMKELIQSFGITMAYIRALITMFFAALFVNTIILESDLDIKKVRKGNTFLTTGVLLASFIGYFYMNNPRLSIFFSTTDHYYAGEELINRFCGVSADPNYYSALVVFAIASNLFQFLYDTRFYYIVATVVLGILGMLSLSKMFLLLFFITIILFVFTFLKGRNLLSGKNIAICIVVSIGFLVGTNFIINSRTFQVIIMRMGSGGIDRLTTGRFDTWVGYIEALTNNIEYFLLGSSKDAAIIGVHKTHNTILQILWKFGIGGFSCVLVWFVTMSQKCHAHKIRGSFLLLIGCFGASLALDMFFFEQYFWFYAFYLLCKRAVYNLKAYQLPQNILVK